MAFDVLESPRF